jgi:hypothetical protein
MNEENEKEILDISFEQIKQIEKERERMSKTLLASSRSPK